MKFIYTLLTIIALAAFSYGQGEQSPIIEKEFNYKNWTYKDIQTDKELSLRKFAENKKLVMVVYWAPWCPNWKHDAPYVQGLYEKYKDKGFDVIGVGEYDTIDKMKEHMKLFKLSFPSVYESTASSEREKTEHFSQRRTAGDIRKWGSPWYIFVDPSKIEAEGDVIAKKLSVVNGELIRDDVEKYIRKNLGITETGAASAGHR